MRQTLFTIGYEKRSIDEFIALLKHDAIDAVVDVRDVAWSHKPGFAKSVLRHHLAAAGIEYVHAQFVGNPKRLRAKGGSARQLIARYVRHLNADASLVRQFDQLVEELRMRAPRIALVCFERDPAMCHRAVIADRWRRRWGRRRRREIAHLGTTAPS